MNFAIRADSSFEIGTGHTMRCITLAEALRQKGHNCFFISKTHEGNINNQIIKKNFNLHEINTSPYRKNEKEQTMHYHWLGSSWSNDAQQTEAILRKINPDWIIVDHYSLDYLWHKKVSKYVKNIMVIDDLADRKLYCNILLDQNLGAEKSQYNPLVPENCKKFLGPKYSLLRPEFSNFRKKSLLKRNTGKLEKLLINFGGGDKLNLTEKVLHTLHKMQLTENISIDVVMGPQASMPNNLSNYTHKIKINFLKNIANMAEVMMNADLAISAGGSTTWERCSLGLPSIIFSVADNQKKIAKNIEEIGAGVTLPLESLSDGTFQDTFKEFFNNELLLKYSKAAASITDGTGINNVVGGFYD